MINEKKKKILSIHLGEAMWQQYQQATLDYHALAINLHHDGQSLGVARIDDVKFC